MEKRKVIEYSLVGLLLLASFFTYLMIQNRKDSFQGLRPSQDLRPEILDRGLKEGIYQYRLENYDRAEMHLLNTFEKSKKRKTRSLAALYLGNLYFRTADYETSIDFYREAGSLNKRNVYALHNAAVAFSKKREWRNALTYAQKALERKDDFKPTSLFLANMYYGMGRFNKALPLYEAGEDDDIFRYNLAMLFKRENRIDEAVKLLMDITTGIDTDEVLRSISAYSLGVLEYQREGRRALDFLKKALEAFPSSPELRFNMALLLMKEKQYREAADLLKSIKAMITDGVRDEFYKLYGQAVYRSEDYREALILFSDLYAEMEEEWIASVLGDIYVELGDLELAETYYRVALNDPGNDHAFANLARVYAEKGEFERALDVCREYARNSANNPRPYIYLADIYFRTGDIGLAKDNLEIALELTGDDASGIGRVAAVYQKYKMQNNALQLYHKILTHEPENYRVHGKIAQIYLETGHNSRAKRVLLRIRNNTPEMELYYSVSLLLAQTGSVSEAVAIYRGLIRDFPYRYEAYYNLALVYIEDGEYENTLSTVQECFDKVSRPDNSILSKLHSISGIAYLSLGNLREASRSFETARDLDEGDEIPVMNLKLVSELAL